MTLDLDARQRVMLDEMGVKVWWPNAPVAMATPEAAAAPGAVAPRASAAATAPARHADTSGRVAPPAPPKPPAAATRVDAPPPNARSGAAHGSAVLLLEPAQRLYDGSGPVEGGWLIVADMPPESDGRYGAAFAGDAGRLLDQMLRALHLQDNGQPVHLMRAHRGSLLGGADAPQPFAEIFAAQAAALAPRIVLTMGPLATQTLLDSTEPLGKLRGRALPMAGLPGTALVATYPPAYLLRNPADKAKAWADLCLAAANP